MRRKRAETVDGVLVIDKPSGPTSHDVVQRIRKSSGVKKVGHAGTLDPSAMGVLVVCLGKATRLIRFMPDDKEYKAEMVLGVTTSTQDASGEVLSRREGVNVSQEKLEETLKKFVGEIEQVPPMTSARHYRGERLYRLARRGISVEREATKTFIHRIDLVSLNSPKAVFVVSCAKGTYVRTLCADIGNALGYGAYLSMLVRTRVGRFTLAEAVALDELTPSALARYTISIDEAFRDLPGAVVKEKAVERVSNGMPLHPEDLDSPPQGAEAGEIVKILSRGGVLLAIAEASADRGDGRSLRMLRVLS